MGGLSDTPAESNPYGRPQTETAPETCSSWPGRGRKSHLSSSNPAATTSEEILFAGGRLKTAGVSKPVQSHQSTWLRCTDSSSSTDGNR
jgi:hypothetical protein